MLVNGTKYKQPNPTPNATCPASSHPHRQGLTGQMITQITKRMMPTTKAPIPMPRMMPTSSWLSCNQKQARSSDGKIPSATNPTAIHRRMRQPVLPLHQALWGLPAGRRGS